MHVCTIIPPAMLLVFLMTVLMLAGMVILGALSFVTQLISDLPRFHRQGILIGFELVMESLPERIGGKLIKATRYWFFSALIAIGYVLLTVMIASLLFCLP